MANSATVGLLRVLLTTNTAEFHTAMKSAGDSAKVLSRDLSQIGRQAQQVGRALTTTLTLPILAISGAAVKMAMDLNKSMANVATLIPNSTARVVELKKEVQDLAIATGKSTADLADGLYQVISAFGDSADTAKILGINARAAAAGLATTTDAINLTSAVTKGYGDTSAEAVQKASDLAFITVKLGKTTFPELAAAIGGVVPIAAKLNVSQEELFAGFSTLTGVTGNTSEVATQLTSVLTAMMKPTDEMAAATKRLGFAGSEAMVQQLGLIGSLKALIGTTNGSAEAVGTLLGRKEALTAAFALTGSQAETFATKLEQVQKAAGATDEAFKEQSAGVNKLGFVWGQLQQRLAVIGQRIGDALIPALSALTSTVVAVLPVVEMLVKGFTALPTAVQLGAIGLLGVAAAAGPALFIFGQLAASAAALTAAFTTTGIATRLLAQWHLAAVGPVTALRGAFQAVTVFIVGAYAPGLRVLQGALVGVGNTTVVVTAQKLLMAAADRVTAVAAGIAATAQRVLGGAMVATQIAASGLLARLGLLNVANAATAASSRVLAGALGAVGVAASTLLAFGTIAGLFVALGFAAKEAAKGAMNLWTALKEGTFWATVTARETDNWVRRLLGLSSGAKQAAKDFDETALHAKAATDAIQAAANRLSGDDLKNRVNEIGLAWARMLETGKATPAAAQRTAAELKALAEQGAKIPPALNAAVTAMAALAKSSETTSEGLAAASARAREYDADLKKLGSEGLAVVRREHERGVGVKKLAEEWGVAESSIERYLKSLKSAGDEYSKLVARMRGTELLETAAAWQELLQVPGNEAKVLANESLRRDLIAALDAVERRFGSLQKAGLAALVPVKNAADAAANAWKNLPIMLGFTMKQLETLQRLPTPEFSGYDPAKDPGHLPLFFLGGLSLHQFKSITAEAQSEQERIRRETFSQPSTGYDPAKDPQHVPLVFLNGLSLAQFKSTLHDASQIAKKGFFASAFGSSAQLGQQLAQTVIGAIQGGGNPIAAAASLVGSTLMGGLAKSLTTAKDGAKAALSGWIGGAANAVLPFVGSLMGPLINKIVGFFGSAGRDAVKAFAEKMGGFDALSAKLSTLGAEGERLWKNLTQGVGRNDPKAAQAAIAAIEKALADAEKRTAQFNTSLGTTLQKIRDLGGQIPEALRPYLDGLRDAGRLTEDNIALLAELTGGGAIDWKKIEEAAARYGITQDKLGSSFHNLKLHDAWQQLIDDLDLFERGQVDVNAALVDMADEISALVQQSVKFGTEIPENMRPWIQQLIDAGLLLDESGDKITDIGKLTFGETLQTSLQKLTDAIKDLIAEFNKVPGAVNAIPRNITTTVTVRERREVETVDVGDGGLSHAAMGGLVTALGVQYLNRGGPIWKPRGTDTVPAMLTPGEGVVNTLGMGVLGADGLGALNRGLQPTNIWQTLRAALSTIHTQAQGGSPMGAPPAGAAGAPNIGPITLKASINIPPGELSRSMRDGAPIMVDLLLDNHGGLGTRLFGRGATLGTI